MKKFLLIYMVCLFVIGIYLINKDNRQLIFKMGDSISLSINSYNIPSYDKYFEDKLGKKLEDYIIYGYHNYSIGQLKRDIENNIKINNRNIQNILIKSDLIIVEIGMDELAASLNVNDKYNYLDGMIRDMNELISLIRKYCKEKIVLVGYYNPSSIDNKKYIDYINDKYKEISKKYKVTYIDVSTLNNKEYFQSSNYHLNDKGYNWLNNQIIESIY